MSGASLDERAKEEAARLRAKGVDDAMYID